MRRLPSAVVQGRVCACALEDSFMLDFFSSPFFLPFSFFSLVGSPPILV